MTDDPLGLGVLSHDPSLWIRIGQEQVSPNYAPKFVRTAFVTRLGMDLVHIYIAIIPFPLLGNTSANTAGENVMERKVYE